MLRRKRQFAVMKPTTKTRVDLGLTLGDVKPVGRLESAGNVGGGRITHLIKIESTKSIDAEVKRWLKEAYTRDS